VDERAALAGDGFLNDRMAVAEGVDADAAEQVKVLRTVLVDNVNALTTNEKDGVAVVGGKQKPAFSGANLIEFGQFISLLKNVGLRFVNVRAWFAAIPQGLKPRVYSGSLFGTTKVVP
jgi:hypothetical protein